MPDNNQTCNNLCIIAGYDNDSDVEKEESLDYKGLDERVSPPKKCEKNLKKIRLSTYITDNHPPPQKPSIFSSAEEEDAYGTGNSSDTRRFYGAPKDGCHFLTRLPQPQRTVYGATGVSSMPTPKLIKTTIKEDKINRHAKISPNSDPIRSIISELDELSDEEILITSLSNKTIETLGKADGVTSLFTLPSETEEPVDIHTSELNSFNDAPSISIQNSVQPVSLWSSQGLKSRVSDGDEQNYTDHTMRMDKMDDNNNIRSFQPISSETIMDYPIPKGREWRGFPQIENASSSSQHKGSGDIGVSIAVSSNDLKDPNWMRNFATGDGRLKRKKLLTASGITLSSSLEPSRRQRQKHQINWLAQDAADKEADIMNRSSQQRLTKYQTQMKYGW